MYIESIRLEIQMPNPVSFLVYNIKMIKKGTMFSRTTFIGPECISEGGFLNILVKTLAANTG